MKATTFRCRCGQTPKTIILVGCTQHGKSSMIRALLDYAGMRKEGDEVKIGAYGNSSTTKECTIFEIDATIRRHFLRDDEGEIHSPSMDTFTSSDVTDLMEIAVEEFSRSSGNHIHLRVIDTPGLDDSDNAAEARKKGSLQGSQNTIPLRVVDEKHKMAILRTLAMGVASINSVCFVISSQSPMNASLQQLLKEYMEIFNMSGLGSSYHFIHTKVDAEALFDPITRGRPTAVDKLFTTRGAKHHFMENLPDPNDPVSLYFAHQGMAKFLSDISTDAPQSMTSLKYPKSDGHRYMEKGLRLAMDLDEKYYEGLEDKHANAILVIDAKRQRLKAREKTEKDSWSSLVDDINALNTTELVQMNNSKPYTGFERAHFWSKSIVSLNITTDCPIRKVWKSPDDQDLCTWASNDSKALGKTSYSNTLTSTGRNTELEVKVCLYGYKKEVEAAKISRLEKEKSEAYEELSSTGREITEIDKDKAEIELAREANKKKITSCRANKARLGVSHISANQIKTDGWYFATSSLISYGFACNFTLNRIHKFQFPTPYTDESLTSAQSRYQTKARVYEAMVNTCESTIAYLNQTIQEVQNTLSGLGACKDSVEAALAAARKHVSDLDEWKPPTTTTTDGQTATTAEQRGLGYFRQDFLPLLEFGRDKAEEALREHGVRLVLRQELIAEATHKTKQLKEKNMVARQRWLDKRADAQASLAAARAMNGSILCKGDFLPGVFAALKEGIDEYGAGSDKVWDLVFFHLREAYGDDPSRWDELLIVL